MIIPWFTGPGSSSVAEFIYAPAVVGASFYVFRRTDPEVIMPIPRWRILLVAGLLVFGNGAAAQTLPDRLRMVFFPFPPFNYTDATGQARGDLVDLFRRMTAHLGIEADIREYPVARARTMVIAGEADVLLTNNSAPELRGHILSSPEPIDQLVTQAFTLTPGLALASQHDLRGRSVILQQRFSYGQLRQFVETPANGVTVVGDPPDSASGLRMLLARRADIFVQYQTKFKEATDEVRPTVPIYAHTLSVLPIHINVSRRLIHAEFVLERLIAAHSAVASPGQGTRSDAPLETRTTPQYES